MTYYYESDLLVGGVLVGFIIFSIVIGMLSYILNALIFYNTSKVNGLEDIAYISWIPIVNCYILFALTSKKTTYEDRKKDATKWFIIYFGLSVLAILLSFVPILPSLILFTCSIIYLVFLYRLFYRWSPESGMSILFIILTIITGGLFFIIYGLIKMKKPFVTQ